MSRAPGSYKGTSEKDQVAPILFLRVLNLPSKANPSEKTNLYLTDAEEPISFFDENGNAEAYLPVGLTFDKVSADQTQEVKAFRLTIDNVGREFCSLASTVEIEGCEVHVLRAFRENLSAPESAQTVIVGRINSWAIGESEIEAEVQIPISLRQRVPRRMFWPLCNWQYKSDECGYSGVQTACDHTLDTCKAYGNNGRFGGFPHLLKSRDPSNVWTKN